MNLSLFIAGRYLFSKNNRNAINIISSIAVVVLTVATAALIIILSVFNGIDKVISERINTYAPDLKIVPTKGKTFSTEGKTFVQLSAIEGIEVYSKVLEENVLIKSDYKQIIAIIKGVDNKYNRINKINSLVVAGEYNIAENNRNALFGHLLASRLGLSIPSVHGVSVWIPDRKNINTVNPENSFDKILLFPTGVGQIEETFDSKYVLTSLTNIQNLTRRDSHTVSAIEIKVKADYKTQKVKKDVIALLGSDYKVKNRIEQYDILYSVMKSEKLATFLILVFIILIAGFSITSSVIMLIIEKKKDMTTLLSLGIKYSSIQKIFLTEGMMITLLSGIIGLSLGGAFCYLQQEFGFVSYSVGDDVITPVYPIKLKLSDFVYSFISVLVIGTIISVFPVLRIKKYLSS